MADLRRAKMLLRTYVLVPIVFAVAVPMLVVIWAFMMVTGGERKGW